MKLILNMFFCLIIKIYTDLNIINKRTSLPYFGVKLSCVCLMFAEGESKEEDIAAQRPAPRTGCARARSFFFNKVIFSKHSFEH